MTKNRIARAFVAAVALVGTLSMAVPASAATSYTYKKVCQKTPTGATRCYYKWVPVETQPAPSPTPTPTPTPGPSESGMTADEQQMLNLVNGERTKLGLKPLVADPELVKVARLKSQDMVNKNYFSHNSPTYGSPFDMLKQFGITYKTAGENIAGNGSVSGAHTSLMNSPGHRANILNTGFTHVGIGIVDGGPYGKMFTQMFVGR